MLRGVVLVVLIAVLALGAWIVVPMLAEPESVALAGDADMRALLGLAPPSASQAFLIPAFGPAWRRFEPLLLPLLDLNGNESSIGAAAWLLGPSPVLLWSSGQSWGAIADPDPLRAALLRVAAVFLPDLEIRFERSRAFLNAGTAVAPVAIEDALVGDLRGHAFVYHREGSDGYPPLERPALSAITFEEGTLQVMTRGRSARPLRTRDLSGTTLPAGALLAARFAEPPEAILAIEKAIPISLPAYLADGGMVALYGIESEGIVPRPRLVFAIPADEPRSRDLIAAIDRLTTRGAMRYLLGMEQDRQRLVAGIPVTRREGIGLTIEFANRGEEFLFAFDGVSLERLLTDREVPAGVGEAAWALRGSPEHLLPLLEELGRNEALRLFARDFSTETLRVAQALRNLPSAKELRATLHPGPDGMVLRAEAELAK